ncbi:MAG TPA: hypothetical protein VG738_21040 [Chitinophagaceae bacterium]|nr:hypothetical protein [Chitinophagaceae bacterium]
MKRITLLLFALSLKTVLFAQVDTIDTKTNKLLIHNLPEGAATYVVYFVDSATNEITGPSDIWVRTTQYSTFHNADAIQFDWKWYHHDSLYKTVRDICRKNDMAPLYAYGNSVRTGIRAYNFTDGYMVAADTVAGNNADASKKVALTVPVYNWEWDMELFSTLPYKKVGQQFEIAFLDPNDNKPAYYLHTVIGTDELAVNKQAKIKCWILRVGYSATAYADFWISQQSHEMLKMKGYYNGRYRYKVKLY